ncbi:MAG: hypothetical protein Q8N44_04965 [Rubrivivax sp.]|nr:hypothetical protein [Rubrivivax sp.]MDP3083029.1 hypothetical protein [Rubrivivax sp.]
MFGPQILTRTLTKSTTGTGQGFQFGNSWQYHSRSDRHSKVACWGLTFDLLSHCALLRKHIQAGKVALGINHELRDFRNSKKKNLDLVLCRATEQPVKAGSRSGARSATDFASLAGAYGIDLTAKERIALASMPMLPIAGVSSVLVATEAKAAMTAFLKARPRLKDELTSSHQTIHGDTQDAIAAGLVIVNAASTFVSPDKNKHDLGQVRAVVSEHRQPNDAEKVIAGLRDLQRRATVSDSGFDAIGVVVIDCANDGSPIKHVTRHPPAPSAADDFDYARFVHRLAQLYATRFKEL